jgi:hypothetical protein
MPKVKLLQHQVPFSARRTLPPQRVALDPNDRRARQLRLQQKRDKVNRLRVLQDHARQGDFEVLRQVNQDREDARKQAKKKLAAQAEQTRQLDKKKRIKKRETNAKKTKGEAKRGTEDGGEAAGWAPRHARMPHSSGDVSAACA